MTRYGVLATPSLALSYTHTYLLAVYTDEFAHPRRAGTLPPSNQCVLLVCVYSGSNWIGGQIANYWHVLRFVLIS